MTSASRAIARLMVLEAIRSKLVWLAVLATGMSAVAGLFFQQLAITESQSTYTAITAALSRGASVLVVCLFLTTSVMRDVQDRSLEWLMAMPIRRADYPLGKLIGVLPLLVGLSALSGLFVAPYAHASAVVMWSLSLTCELLLVAAFALLCALGLKQLPAAVCSTLGFYALARSLDSIVLMSNTPVLPQASLAAEVFQRLSELLATLLPSLQRFADADWLLYDPPSNPLFYVFGQTVVYLSVLLCAVLIDFHRREF